MRLYPFEHVTAKVLSVYLPVRFEVLPRAHEQPRRPAGVAVDERRQIVDAAAEGVPERILVVVLLDLLEGYGGEVGTGGGLVEVGPRGICGVVPILAISIKSIVPSMQRERSELPPDQSLFFASITLSYPNSLAATSGF